MSFVAGHTEEIRLREAINSGTCVAVVGSGPSMEAGYPSWTSLIKELCSATGVAYLPQSEGVLVDDVNNLLQLARLCRDATESKYLDVLRSCFAGAPPSIPDTLRYLAKLHFKSYVTTTFDPLLERALQDEGNCKAVFTFPQPLPVSFDNVYLWLLHGRIRQNLVSNATDVVLTDRDFEQAYDPTGPLWGFLYQLLTFHSCCFIGCGLQEPPFSKLLEICREVREKAARAGSEDPPEHFVLLGDPPQVVINAAEENAPEKAKAMEQQAAQSEADRLLRLGITVVRYQLGGDGQHLRLRDFLRDECLAPSPIKALTFLPTATP